MTDKELIKILEPLENKMLTFQKTNGGSLTADDIQLIKNIYPELNDRTMNQLPRLFVTSCSSCVREVFNIVCSWYFRTKEILSQQALNEASQTNENKLKTPAKKSVGIKK